MANHEFWSGNIAIAEGALKAGVRFYAGYPITPSSDLMEYMARRLPQNGGIFIQGEDEIASINMIIGASIAGYKSMTATSGPGYSLMQEALGLAVMLEVPIVVVNIMRLGPSTGQATKSGQGDIMQARWGRHGDQYTVVYTASSPQEAYYIAIEAFNTSEKYRVPVTLLIDELTAHIWETIEIGREIEIINRRWTDRETDYFNSSDPSTAPPMPRLGVGLNVLYTSSTHDGRGYRKTQDPETHNKLVRRLRDKILKNVNDIFKYNVYGSDRPDIFIIAYGSVSRSCRALIKKLEYNGIKASLLELKTLWPIDYKRLREIISDANIVIVPEMNLGQLIYDIYQVKSRENVYPYNKIGGGIPIYPDELYEFIMEVYKK
jgi:2-oxoglutarate ferredoxin oxidoreductase subunit alpha